jgi:perosamine synthetase
MDHALNGVPGVQTPVVPAGREHVYYQYCVYTPDRDRAVTQCVRRGIDIETLHVDVCSRLELFESFHTDAPGAERAADVIQVPVYASLNDDEIARVARTVRKAMARHRGRRSTSANRQHTL